MIYKINLRAILNAKRRVLLSTTKLPIKGTGENPQFINIGLTCSLEEERDLVKLCKEYKDVFEWTYDDLKNFYPSIIHHNIPLNPDINPYQQKLKKMHRILDPSIKKELDKLLNARIVFPVRHTQWISNLVTIHKKTREIRLCVDFRNPNRDS